MRTGSLAGAAQALHVTPSAVSHLVRELEKTLSLPLLAGKGQRTETGEQLARRLIPAFAAIDAAVTEARHHAGDIRVSALSSFLTLWLVPRLPAFQADYPATRLLLTTGTRPVDLDTEPYECAIRWGRGAWPGLETTLLFRDQPVVVTNPRLTADPEYLPRLAARARDTDWTLVAAALGWRDTEPALTFETRALAVQAAIAGMGAAVVDRNLVAGMIAGGILAEIAPDPPVPAPEGHHFVARPDRLRAPPLQKFRDWLLAEANPPLAAA